MSDTPTPFQSKSLDGRPQWQIIYDHIAARIIEGTDEDVITHDELSELLDGAEHRSYISRVITELQEQHAKTLESVRGQGYIIVHGLRHLKRSNKLQRRSHRTLGRAVQAAATVDTSDLTPTEKKLVEATAVGMQLLADAVQVTAEKVTAHEEQIRRLQGQTHYSSLRHQSTEQTIEELRARIDELEATNQDRKPD